MAQNVFDATLDVNNQIKVNTFDWSHANNLTTQIGRVTPIFCELVPSKSSVRINPRMGLQFMPMVFPIQTRMKARVAFFKYPLRALWSGYRDFVGNFRQDLEEPYINLNNSFKLKKMASTGSLGDYLGLPTTIFGSFGQGAANPFVTTVLRCPGNKAGGNPEYTMFDFLPITDVGQYYSFLMKYGVTFESTVGGVSVPGAASASSSNFVQFGYNLVKAKISIDDTFNASKRLCLSISYNDLKNPSQSLIDAFVNKLACFVSKSDDVNTYFSLKEVYSLFNNKTKKVEVYFALPEDFVQYVPEHIGEEFDFHIYYNVIERLGRKISGSTTSWIYTFHRDVIYPLEPDRIDYETSSGFSYPAPLGLKFSYQFYDYSDSPADLTLSTSPYFSSVSGSNKKQIKISAYAFRAYEGIYNSYIRDNRNNPYYVNGQVQYNQWIPTYDGGLDDNVYELRQANWERDFLTTAVQSPQQGTAPLVGITTYTETVNDVLSDGTAVTRELSKIALVDEDGKKYALSWESDGEALTGVEYTELDNGVKMRQPRSLVDVAMSGISISDLRNVNAYQKFLELNMRKGYSYRDIVEGRFDVKVRYDELLMPEFFGGFTRDIDMHAISQSVDQNLAKSTPTYAGALGSQSGIAGVRGDSNQTIECFCDEESIVMGVLIITPTPVYTQLLPKHFTYRGLLDHYQPEFNHIGFQPILYKEVCPIQSYNQDPDSLVETFGYNRPWYEYVQKYDSAHGLFRTNLSNFLMHRVFNEKPQLSKSFLVIDPDQVTDVFAVTQADDGTELTDKIYGQIYFDCQVKLPISRVAIPRLD
nr:MAG TPA: Major capsid protein [Microviridae sp.]